MIPRCAPTRAAAPGWYRPALAALAVVAALAATPRFAAAGEGGATHVLPGANATLVDMAPTTPGWFVKPMLMNYGGDATARIPTGAGVTSNLDVDATTFVLGGGYTFAQTVLGGAHYTVAVFQPYTWLDISGMVDLPGGGAVQRNNKVSGFGDMTIVPVLLGWKAGDWQFDALMPVYAPVGSYQKGRLGNPGLNYWTFDPQGGIGYMNKAKGFNAMLHAGIAFNTENPDTDYKSGSLLHLDGAVQQIVPAMGGLLTLGAEVFYFQQLSADGGSGATLGDFKGRTAGLGPVIGWIKPLGQQSLSLEFKWLAETDVKNRVKGDYLWVKAVYKF
jgi:hypothetical protein